MSDDIYARKDVLEANFAEMRAVIEGNEKYTAEAIAAMNRRIDDLKDNLAAMDSKASIRWSIVCAALALAGVILALIP